MKKVEGNTNALRICFRVAEDLFDTTEHVPLGRILCCFWVCHYTADRLRISFDFYLDFATPFSTMDRQMQEPEDAYLTDYEEGFEGLLRSDSDLGAGELCPPGLHLRSKYGGPMPPGLRMNRGSPKYGLPL